MNHQRSRSTPLKCVQARKAQDGLASLRGDRDEITGGHQCHAGTLLKKPFGSLGPRGALKAPTGLAWPFSHPIKPTGFTWDRGLPRG